MQETKERAVAPLAARSSMIGTLLVHAEPGAASSHRVEMAARLARECGARLIGLGAEALEPLPSPDPFTGVATGEWVALIQEQLTRNLKSAEAAFARDSAGADVEWRAIQDYPDRALARNARAADVIIVSPKGRTPHTIAADPGDVVMTAGRPVLVVPEGGNHLRGRVVLVAYKDSRECRRAVADALPFLVRAEEVVVHAACKAGEEDRMVFELDDVVANLKRHGVTARQRVTTAPADAVADELERVAALVDADLIVAGAYGHSRVREWAFGGVTETFLRRPRAFVLLSH